MKVKHGDHELLFVREKSTEDDVKSDYRLSLYFDPWLVRNSTLLLKEDSQLTENERIIRRSVEKVDTWLRDLPPSFNPIHEIMRPYLAEKRV